MCWETSWRRQDMAHELASPPRQPDNGRSFFHGELAGTSRLPGPTLHLAKAPMAGIRYRNHLPWCTTSGFAGFPPVMSLSFPLRKSSVESRRKGLHVLTWLAAGFNIKVLSQSWSLREVYFSYQRTTPVVDKAMIL